MCVNKLYIANNKLDFNELIDRPYYYVPCGQCEECLRNRATQFETRAIAEYEYSKSLGGRTFFYTLTYNDRYVPKFKGMNVFSKYDLKCFFKRVRKHLNKLGLPSNFRYFATSEYGHLTLRPHYHMLLFFDHFISSVVLHSIIEDEWRYFRPDEKNVFFKNGRYFRDYTKEGLGWVKPGKKLGAVYDVRPCRYVAKYINKDTASFSELSKKGFSEEELQDYKVNKKEKYSNIDILPFHLQSIHFGLSLLDTIQYDDYIQGYFCRTDSLAKSSKVRKVPVPLYIYRKRFYEPYVNSNGNISYILTDEGLDVQRARLKNQYEFKCNLYDFLLDFIASHYNQLDSVTKLFTDYEHFKSFACAFRTDCFSKKLAAFSLLWHDNALIPFTYKDFDTDLDLYFHWLRTVPYLYSDTSNIIYYHIPDDINSLCSDLLVMFDEAESLMKYEDYLLRCDSYNIEQQFRSLTTGVYKPTYIKSYEEFINLKRCYLCLTILQSKGFRSNVQDTEIRLKGLKSLLPVLN